MLRGILTYLLDIQQQEATKPLVAREIETPTRELKASDWLVPTCSAMAAGFLSGIAGNAVLAFWDYLVKDHGMTTQGRNLASCALGGVVCVIVLFVWLAWMKSTDFIYATEREYQTPTDHGQQIVNKSYVQIDKNQMQILSIPGNPETLRRFYQAALEGNSLGFRSWRGQFMDHTGKRDMFPEVRAALVGAGMLQDHGTQGLRLTPKGRLYMQQQLHPPTQAQVPLLAESTQTHTDTQGVGG